MPLFLSTELRATCIERSLASSVAIALLGALLFTRPLSAQERCDEATVRKLAAVSVTERATPDLYFNVVTAQPPFVGTAALDTLAKLHGSERKNEQPHVFTILQVSATADGAMAYDDGSVRVEYDDAETGKHVKYDLSYLRVWRVVGGRCVTAAMYGRRETVVGR
ncbi:MAG: hypothetical protein JJD97_02750 [Gemmatimonadaceae bacterium]|nr:hypothetical protein [Gemmatimonadaceae bacterium]